MAKGKMKKNIDITYVVLILLLVSACFVSWKLYFQVYTQKDTVSIHEFPKEIAGWTSEDVELTEKEYAILETRNTFVRHYTSPEGEEINLYLIYSQNNRKVAHPPEVCYTGGGTSIISKKLESIPLANGAGTMSMNNLVMDSINYQQVVMYTFKVGSDFTPNYWKQQLLIAIKTLLGKPASSALIRISAVVKDNDVSRTEKTITDFLRMIQPFISQYLP